MDSVTFSYPGRCSWIRHRPGPLWRAHGCDERRLALIVVTFFNGQGLQQWWPQRREEVKAVIRSLDFDAVRTERLRTKVAAQLDRRYRLVPVVLHSGKVRQETPAERFVVTEDFRGRVRRRKLDHAWEIPFTGSAVLLTLRPNPCSMCPPDGQLKDQTIRLTSTLDAEATHDQIKAVFATQIADIEKHLDYGAGPVSELNEWLDNELRAAIDHRYEQLNAVRGTVAALGHPVKRKPNAVRVALLSAWASLKAKCRQVFSHKYWNARTGVVGLLALVVGFAAGVFAVLQYVDPQAPDGPLPPVPTSTAVVVTEISPARPTQPPSTSPTSSDASAEQTRVNPQASLSEPASPPPLTTASASPR